MNIQAMMKQAQALQKDMLKVKNEIDNSEFVGESSIVKITMKGNRNVTKVEINSDNTLEKDDIEMLQDMIIKKLILKLIKKWENLVIFQVYFNNVPR